MIHKFQYWMLFALISLTACSSDKSNEKSESVVLEPKPSSSLFQRVSPQVSGIQFSNDIIQNAKYNIHYYSYMFNGGGVAIGDINNDDLPDVFFTGNQIPNRLYLNKGDFQFEDITTSSGTDGWSQGVPRTWSSGATMVDINEDGLLDIYVCKSGPYIDSAHKINMFFINNGDLTFTNRAEEMGVADAGFSTQSAFLDYDLDGDLDLYVMNHPVFFQLRLHAAHQLLNQTDTLNAITDNLYRNNGNGTFTKVTEAAGIKRFGYGLGLCAADIDKDGWVDIYVANDFSTPDFMFMNNGDGTFTDRINEKTGHISYYGMGCDIADMNNDMWPDISVLDMTANDHYRNKTLMPSMNPAAFHGLHRDFGYQYQYMFNTLQLNHGNGQFSEIGQLAGLHKTDWSWSNLLVDFDSDSDKDLYITNGFVQDSKNNDINMQVAARKRQLNTTILPGSEVMQWVKKYPSHRIPNYYYQQTSLLQFKDQSINSGLADYGFSTGAAYGDLDNDGDMDLVVNNINDTAFVYRNQAAQNIANNYLNIKLIGDSKDIIGHNTKLTIHYGDEEQQYQELALTRGFQSSMQNLLHFGLAQYDKVDRIEVEWLDGRVQILKDVTVNQTLSIRHADSYARSPKDIRFSTPFKDITTKSGLKYKHQENSFNDFTKEILLPQKQSEQGPCTATADINGDGLDDIFLGGAMGQSASLYVQKSQGKFRLQSVPSFTTDKQHEDVAATFFDADSDGDQDLYVVSGGGGDLEGETDLLQDRLYINDGKGNFQADKTALPPMPHCTSVVKAYDYDLDGDFDLFVGGRAIPGHYPESEPSFLLRNEAGKFEDVTKTLAPDLANAGMVNDALWVDADGDKKLELVVVAEWQPIAIYKINTDQLVKKDLNPEVSDISGWWQSIVSGDFDNDGDLDLVLGNMGKNIKFKASASRPFHVYAADFDNSGTLDIVLSNEYQGSYVPVRGRECSTDQMPFIAQKYPTFHTFATASIQDIYGKEALDKALHLKTTHFESMYFANDGKGNFVAAPLPIMAQLSPIRSLITQDLNGDGHLDILGVGNMYGTEVETIRYDAGIGCVLLGDGKGNFEAQNGVESGFYILGDTRSLSQVNDMIVVTKNNDSAQVFQLPNSKTLSRK